MPRRVPFVTIGLPVHNGEALLEAALDSLLAQTFGDFELLVVDNASTDGTRAIAEAAARRDGRIRYVRNATNIGGIPNFNRAFRLSGSPYFKWAAYDDLVDPTYLEKTLALLESHDDAVFAFSQSVVIDEHDERLPFEAATSAYVLRNGDRWVYDRAAEDDLLADDPATRFAALVRSKVSGTVVYGLFRASALRRTRLFRFYGSDGLLLAEAALLGRFLRVDEPLFFRRLHPEATWKCTRRQVLRFEGAERPAALPPLRSAIGYVGAIRRSRVSALTKARCLAALARRPAAYRAPAPRVSTARPAPDVRPA